MKRRRRILLPILLLIIGLVGMRGLRSMRAEPERNPRTIVAPTVQTETVHVGPHRLVVRTQGTVTPRTSSRLVAEVAGRVIEVAENFVTGAFFAKGDTLLILDDRDYRAALAAARAQLATAQLRLELEMEERRVAEEEWESFDRGAPTDLVLREPQLAEARANVAAAEAQATKALRDLDRTRLTTPYDGRVQTKSADLGDFLTTGATAATLYAVDYAEVRLPLPDAELAYLDLPLGFRHDKSHAGPRVRLSSNFAQHKQVWEGYVDRSEGEIDAQTRMVHLVARVKDPYERHSGAAVPLTVGMFVDAEILGREVEAASIPTAALLQNSRVLIVSEDDRIEIREVDVLRRGPQRILVASGITDGERICVTALATVVDGMSVRPVKANDRASQ